MSYIIAYIINNHLIYNMMIVNKKRAPFKQLTRVFKF